MKLTCGKSPVRYARIWQCCTWNEEQISNAIHHKIYKKLEHKFGWKYHFEPSLVPWFTVWLPFESD